MEDKKTVFISDSHQLRVPTLLIGVGGIGGQIVKGVFDSLSEYDKRYVEMIVMDTNINDLRKFENSGIRYIQTSENKSVQAYLQSNPKYLEWFPTNPLINAKNLTDGAGQIRSVSRLGALASKAAGRFDIIKESINTIRTNHGDTLRTTVKVMIVGSCTGGTGSGVGIQLPFYVRRVLAETAGIPDILVRGLFLMPDLTEGVQDTENKKKAVNVNGYAFLKELNSFYRAQNPSKSTDKIEIEEYERGVKNKDIGDDRLTVSEQIPYDFMFLVEKTNREGSIGDLDNYIMRSMHIVRNQLFSPIAEKGFSSEDNLITSSVEAKGMNRYCGAGISFAKYPKEDIERYCTVRYAEQLLKDYWMKIDDTYKSRDELQRRQRKSNPSLEALDLGETYCSIFDDFCDPTKYSDNSDLAALKGELYVSRKETFGGEERIVKSPIEEMFIEGIKGAVDKAYQDAGFDADASECRMTAIFLKNEDTARSEVSSKIAAIRAFRDETDKKVSDLIVSCAESILPTDIKVAKSASRSSESNIFVMLEKKHPIIARYLLYRMKALIAAEKNDADANLNEKIDSFFSKDYSGFLGKSDRKSNAKVGPEEALARTKAGPLAGIGVNSAAFTRLTNAILKDSGEEISAICMRAENSIKSNVYRMVLERIEVLLELYEEFFSELHDIVESKKSEIEALEKGNPRDYKGDIYICCDAECKKYLYDEFESTVGEQDLEMSDDVKKGFFEKIFAEYTTQLVRKSNPIASVTPPLSMRELFESGVLEPITKQFAGKGNGFGHLDMSIFEAIEKEYRIKNKDNWTAEVEAGFDRYFAGICDSMRSLAAPYLAYDSEVPGHHAGGKLAYSWGVNHSAVAEYQNGDVGTTVDAQKLRDMVKAADGSPNTALADNSFSPFEMVCYTTIYDLCVENLTKYKKGAVAQRYYEERLNNIADQTYKINEDSDGYLSTIHPHLDRHWHEHAYLPELMDYDEVKYQKLIKTAFMLGISLNLCKYYSDEIECRTCWWFKKSDKKNNTPVFVDDKELVNKSYYALYDAFNHNKIIVEDINAYAEGLKDSAYKNQDINGISVEDIKTHEIISSLKKNKEGKNIIDIIYSILVATGDMTIAEELIECLYNYLYDYCYVMMNENDHRAENACLQIARFIGEGSVQLADEKASPNFKGICEKFINA